MFLATGAAWIIRSTLPLAASRAIPIAVPFPIWLYQATVNYSAPFPQSLFKVIFNQIVDLLKAIQQAILTATA